MMTKTTGIDRPNRRTKRGAVAVLVLAAVAASCGSDSGSDAEVAELQPSTTATETVPTSSPEDSSVDASPAMMTSGSVTGTCRYDFVNGSPFQSCRITSEDSFPMKKVFAQSFDSLAVEGTTTPTGGAMAAFGGSNNGLIWAGTLINEDARFVGVTRGVEQFEESTVHSFGFSPGNSPDGGFFLDWLIGDDREVELGADGDSAIVDFECVISGASESCTYSGSDDRFVPEPDERTLVSIEFDDVADPVDAVSGFTSAAEAGAFRAGLIDENGLRRFAGLREAPTEFDGRLIVEEGWGRLDGDIFTGTIHMSLAD